MSVRGMKMRHDGDDGGGGEQRKYIKNIKKYLKNLAKIAPLPIPYSYPFLSVAYHIPLVAYPLQFTLRGHTSLVQLQHKTG